MGSSRDSPGQLESDSLLPLSLPMSEPLDKLLISFVAQTLCHTDHRHMFQSPQCSGPLCIHHSQPWFTSVERRQLPYCVSLTCTILYLVWGSLTLTLV